MELMRERHIISIAESKTRIPLSVLRELVVSFAFSCVLCLILGQIEGVPNATSVDKAVASLKMLLDSPNVQKIFAEKIRILEDILPESGSGRPKRETNAPPGGAFRWWAEKPPERTPLAAMVNRFNFEFIVAFMFDETRIYANHFLLHSLVASQSELYNTNRQPA